MTIPDSVVKHLRVQGNAEPILRRPEARVSSRALMFADPVQGEQLLKVHTGKLWPAIDRNGRWQASIAFDTQTKDRQAGAITGRVKGQMVSRNTPGMGKNEEREPAFPQRLTSPRIA